MLEKFRRSVTGHDNNGDAVFVRQEVVPPVETLLYPGATYWKVWGTEDGIPVVGREDAQVDSPHFPGPGGSRIVITKFAPNTAAGSGAGQHSAEELAEMRADADSKFPGLFDAHAAEENAAFHTSETFDYAFVLEGELVLELDNGVTEQLSAGSIVVQRGTRHAWRNESDSPTLVIFVLLGAHRV